MLAILRAERDCTPWGARRAAAFLAGTALLFNLYLIPGAGEGASPRLSDLLGVLAFGLLLARFARSGLPAGMAGMLAATAFLPALFALVALGGGLAAEPGLSKSAFTGVRYLLSAGVGFALHTLFVDPRTRVALLLGIVAGGLGNVGVMVMQAIGEDQLMRVLGLASALMVEEGFWANGARRVAGMQPHPNGSMAVVSYMVPVVFYLYWAGRTGVLACGAALGALAAASTLTLTRGPLLATIVTLTIAAVAFRDARGTRMMALVGAALAAVALALLGPPGGWDRWLNMADAGANAGERLATILFTLDTVLEWPLGVGVVAAREMLIAGSGVPSSHNSLLGAALGFGVPFTLVVVLVLGVNIVSGRRSAISALYFLISLQLLGVFFCEELLFDPTHIALFCWVAAGAGAHLSTRGVALARVRWESQGALVGGA
jgi:hypothetical protein